MARRLLILAYHRVLDGPDPLRRDNMQVADFEMQMRVLARFFNVVPLVEGVDRLKNGSLPARAVSITFDDGYADNYSVAFPVLRRLGLPATIFVATGFLGGGRMWNDTVIESLRRMTDSVLDFRDLGLGRYEAGDERRRAAAAQEVLSRLKYLAADERDRVTASLAERVATPLPSDLMLEARQVRELSRAGIEIGAHTVTHPILKSLDMDSAAGEITRAKKQLEDITAAPVRSFAYPNGRPGIDYDDEHVRLVREAGFDVAVATSLGIADESSDVLQLPRFGPWSESPWRFGLRLMRMHLA